MNTLKKLLSNENIKSGVIFCNKKIDINKLSLFLKKNNFKTICLHGDMNQSLRIKSLKKFKDSYAEILIASDVAAGIDISGLVMFLISMFQSGRLRSSYWSYWKSR